MGARTDAAPVRAHVKDLVADGMTQAAICRAADASSALLSALLHGQFNPGRTPVQSIDAASAARLLAVQYEPSAAARRPIVCEPGGKFEHVGYRVGQCGVCGELAPIQKLTGAQGSSEVLIKHQRRESARPGVELAPIPTDTAGHDDCGTARGIRRHRREGTELCGPCRWVDRGYSAGFRAGMTRAGRDVRNAIPADLVEGIVGFCRAYVLQPWPPGRPAPRSRTLAKRVVQLADAELVAGDDEVQVA